MNDREFSDIEIFQHSGKGTPLFMAGHKNYLQTDYNNGRRILSSQLNEITSVLQTSVTNQQGSVTDEPGSKLDQKYVRGRYGQN
jgi:hypothetical protein